MIIKGTKMSFTLKPKLILREKIKIYFGSIVSTMVVSELFDR